jgi:hypothetical protein
MKKQIIYVNRHSTQEGRIPEEVMEISQEWTRLANEYGDNEGDIGSCVIGAGFNFTYKNLSYRMIPMSKWQGSLTWEKFVKEIREKLEKIGAENIMYDWGMLD